MAEVDSGSKKREAGGIITGTSRKEMWQWWTADSEKGRRKKGRDYHWGVQRASNVAVVGGRLRIGSWEKGRPRSRENKKVQKRNVDTDRAKRPGPRSLL